MMVGPFCISWPRRLKTCLLRIIRGFWNRGGWTGWVDILFVAHYPGYVSSQSPTRCITSFSFYNPWSLLKAVVYNYIFWNVRRKTLFVITADNLTLLLTFRAGAGCITEVKVVCIISCLYIFLFILLLLLCHFRCFYRKMSSYGVNLVSLIQVTTLAFVAVVQFRSRANRMCILRDVRPKDLCWGLYICPAQSALIVVVCSALRTRVALIYIYF